MPQQSVAVILSGSGSDGSMGVKKLKNAGGYLIAQEPRSAKYASMPQAAISTGAVDAILPPEAIGPHLDQLANQPPAVRTGKANRRSGEIDQVMERINLFSGIDFRGYKTNTIYRRIQQRLSATRTATLADYLRLLDQDHEEVQTLAQNCLVSVTSFFRDSASFEAFGEYASERIAAQASEPIRVWVAGCATGEEAYSMSILLSHKFPERKIQIFATDLDENAIAVARKGIYAAAAVKDIPPEYARGHLSETVQGYAVERATREKVVFARHDIVRDPLFANIDIVTCRNVLIYLKPSLQEEVFAKFHFALRPGGLLFLGRSENVAGVGFDVLDRKHRIYANRAPQRNERQPALSREWPVMERTVESPAPLAATPQILQDGLMEQFAPRAVLLDEALRILSTHGDWTGYLRVPESGSNFSFLNLLPKSLATTIRTLIQRSIAGKPGVAGIHRAIEAGKKKLKAEVTVRKIENPGEPKLFIVAVRDLPARNTPLPIAEDGARFQHMEDLERELLTTRECLQSTVEELETTNEELQALNEEMQASNEELQASNEELHASNEELQSTNEELLTVNEEIEHKSIELSFLIEDLENIQNSLDGPLLVADSRGFLRQVNEEARRMFGLNATHLGGPILMPNDPSLATQVSIRVHQVIESGEPTEMRCQVSSRSYRVVVRPYVGRHKANRGAVVVFHEVTQLVAINDRMRRSEQRTRSVSARHEATLNSLPANIAVLDSKGTIIAVNAAWKRFAQENGLADKRHGVGRNYLGICAQSGDMDCQAVANGLRRVLRGETTEFHHEYPCHSATEQRWFRCTITPAHDAKATGAVVMHFNITDRKLREDREATRGTALDLVSYPLFTADTQGLIEWGNQAFLDLLRVPESEILGQHPSKFELPGNTQGFGALFQTARATGHHARAEMRLNAAGGLSIVAMLHVAPLVSDITGETRFVVTGEDITDQRLTEARMMYSTEHDELTGLLNRKSIITRLESAIARQRESGGSIALLFLDLDRFKDTNDTLGHLAGDQILVEAANRLRANAPNFSQLARFGGDEFVIFVENPGTADDIDILVERLLLAFSRPVLVQGRPLQASASMGIAQFPKDALTAEDLLRTADIAMYRAKADGRRGYRRFDQQIQREIEDRVLIERDLARALTLKDLWVAFQPQVDLATQRVVGAEALLRWNHNGTAQIPISKVIHVAEESGLILPIGQWVIREAIQQLAIWQTIEPGLQLSVNLSAVQFNQQDVFTQIMEQLGSCAVSPQKLKVEITETVLLNRSTRVREALHALHGAGIGLHLDDFGTGYSSLSYLQQFPIEAVKIDGSFLSGVGREAQDEAIVDGIVKLAQALRIHAVAEGVENETQVRFLEQSGCHVGQGFHWGRPMPADEFVAFLKQQQLPQQQGAYHA